MVWILLGIGVLLWTIDAVWAIVYFAVMYIAWSIYNGYLEIKDSDNILLGFCAFVASIAFTPVVMYFLLRKH